MANSLLDVRDLAYVKQTMQRKNKSYDTYEWYYLGTEYDHVAVRKAFNLYAAIREFYSMVAQVVDTDVELIPGDWKTTANQDTIKQFLESSDWDEQGLLMLHYGALYGDFYLKLVDVDGQRYIQPLNPKGVYLGRDFAVIIRDAITDDGDKYEYGEYITPEWVYIFNDGKLVDQMLHGFGGLPVFYGQNKNIGHDMGLNSFYHVINQLNALNEMATFLQEQILMNLAPQKKLENVTDPDQVKTLDLGPNKVVALPPGVKLDLVTGEVDVEGTLKYVQDIKMDTRRSLPELTLVDLRIPGLERPDSEGALQYHEHGLYTKIHRFRVGYDKTLKRAIDLAIPGLPRWRFDPKRSIFGFFDNMQVEVVDTAGSQPLNETNIAPQA